MAAIGEPHTGLSDSEYQAGEATSGAAGRTGYDGEEDDAALTDEGRDG